jgi:hypothetical protein
MTRQTRDYQTGGEDIATHISTPHHFGQSIPPQQLSPMARRIAATIGNGAPVPWAGFVWRQPAHPLRQHLPDRAEDRRSFEAA